VIPAAIAVGVLVPRDKAHDIEVDDVVERFRASTLPADESDGPDSDGAAADEPTATTAPPADINDSGDTPAADEPAAEPTATDPPTTEPSAPAVTLMESGVYVYETVGFEKIDALTGVTHEYPAETTITVLVDECAFVRWDALQERYEEWTLCATPDGIVLTNESWQYHEFFDQETPEAIVCDVEVTVVPVAEGPFEPVPRTCTIAGDRPWLPVWEVLETDTRNVDGQTVDVRHVRMTIDDNDNHYEHLVADWWLAPNGLPIEFSTVKESKSDSVVGDVVYNEEIDFTLLSIEPLR
jgi:hypothetical protein